MSHGRTDRQCGDRIRERGSGIPKLIIYLGVMAVLGIPLAMVSVSISRSTAEGETISMILERNRSAIHRITSEYRKSLRGTTVVGAGGASLQFASNGGFNGAAPLAGPTIRYEIRIADGESPNGADDNGNGLVDEGSLVRTDQTTGEAVILTNALDTSESSFVANGAGVTIELTTSGRTHATKAVTEAERAITIFPRN